MDINLLSVIVPIYKKESTIEDELINILNTLQSTHYDFEIIGIVDGTELDHSLESAKRAAQKSEKIKIYGYRKNHGKGQAVRFGMNKAKGDVVTFIDSGGDINPQGIIMLLEHMKWYNADIIIGSKSHAASKVSYPLKRRILSKFYYYFVKTFFGLRVRDTQTGLKAYKREVLDVVLDKLVVKRFAFDIEILAIANRFGFKRIYEAPVEVNLDFSGTSIGGIFTDNGIWRFISDTVAIWYRMHVLRYYDNDNLRVISYDPDLGININTGGMTDKTQHIINFVDIWYRNIWLFFKGILSLSKNVGVKTNTNYKPLVSIIIICEGWNNFLEESLPHFSNINYDEYETLVFSTEKIDKKYEKIKFISAPNTKNKPAEKRDLAIKYARGELLAFIDDDAYPSENWLKEATKYFSNQQIAAVGGPGVTPRSSSLLEKASGWVSASPLGGFGSTYRFIPQSTRFVDDFPSMNLIVRASDFRAIGGFDSNYYPGEDTKLCLDLTQKLRKKIIYDPEVLVYHHKRPLFEKHLIQVGRYGLHRGHFARVLPQTSRRWFYFIPALMVAGLFLGSLIVSINLLHGESVIYAINTLKTVNLGPDTNGRSLLLLLSSLYIVGLMFYLLLLSVNMVWVYTKSKDIMIAILSLPGVLLTHTWYGVRFIKGWISPEMNDIYGRTV